MSKKGGNFTDKHVTHMLWLGGILIVGLIGMMAALGFAAWLNPGRF